MVLTTTDSAERADELAAGMVEARLAACVQIVPVRSVYRWEGEVRKEGEWLCVAKTAEDRVAALSAHIAAHHSYDEPEIVVVPMDGGAAGYLDWVSAETR